MPRTKPLPKNEIEVVRRFRSLRVGQQLSREDLARLSGWTASLIMRIELGRIPFRLDVGRSLLSAIVGSRVMCAVNPLWLAYGIGEWLVQWPMVLPVSVDMGMDLETTYLEFVSAHRSVIEQLVQSPPPAILPDTWLPAYLRRIKSLICQTEGIAEAQAVIQKVFTESANKLQPASDLASRCLREYRQFTTPAPLEIHLQKGIDVTSENGNTAEMKTEMQRLLAKVKTLTEPKGTKKALADVLNVSPSRITEWLAGGSEPGGQVTLKLLQWVEKQQGQS